MGDLKKESVDMNNIIEEQILKQCKTIKTENFFKCDEEYSLYGLSPVCVLRCVRKVTC
jgi:hypothetical protein